MLEFTNPEVAKAYESPFKGDPIVHQPGGKNGNGFKKKLSTVTKDEADRIFAVPNQNLLKAKEPVTGAKTTTTTTATSAESNRKEKPAATS